MKSFNITVMAEGNFLHVSVTGKNTVENVRHYLEEIYKTCAERGFSAVLIEENLSGPSLPPAEAYKIVTKASALTSPILNKIAYVDINPEHLPSIADLGETVARDRGANVRVFRDVGEAEEWLLLSETS